MIFRYRLRALALTSPDKEISYFHGQVRIWVNQSESIRLGFFSWKYHGMVDDAESERDMDDNGDIGCPDVSVGVARPFRQCVQCLEYFAELK